MKSGAMQHKKLKRLLLFILAASLLSLAGLYLFNKPDSETVSMNDVAIDSSADIKLDGMEQISKKHGITEWKLQASTARLMKKEHKAVLSDVDIVFYMEDKTEVHLTSRTGTMDTKTHDMTFSGTVVVTHKDAVLETDKLHYDKKKHILYSNVKVELTKGDSVIVGDAMRTDLNENTTTLTGNVKGKFSETINML